jgi:hypothetical protein
MGVNMTRAMGTARWLIALGLFLGVQGQSNPTLSRIHATFVDCAGGQADDHFRLYLNDLRTSSGEGPPVEYSVKKAAYGVSADAQLPPGFYDFGLIREGCSAETLLPVLPGRNQEVLLIGANSILLRESTAMVAGTTPFRGYSASIVYYPQDQQGSGPKAYVIDPARIEGDAYYATGIPYGIARLRVWTTGGVGNYLEFKIGAINRANHYIIFNVTAEQVKAAQGL